MEEKSETFSGGQCQVGDTANTFQSDFFNSDRRSQVLVRKTFGDVVDEVSGESFPLAFVNDAVVAALDAELLRSDNAVAEHGHPAGVINVDAQTWKVSKFDATGLRGSEINKKILF